MPTLLTTDKEPLHMNVDSPHRGAFMDELAPRRLRAVLKRSLLRCEQGPWVNFRLSDFLAGRPAASPALP